MTDGTKRADIQAGMRVAIVLKQDQRTGRLTHGIVRDILTKSATHPHGIKVRLENGRVGRVKNTYADYRNDSKGTKMSLNQKQSEKEKARQTIAEMKRFREQRENTYREKALKMFPWVCGRCGREFSGKRLRELTVHHRDHDHDNNPPDGSNWELLCIYCHDNEHARFEVADAYDGAAPGEESSSSAPLDSPFAGLGDLMKKKESSDPSRSSS